MKEVNKNNEEFEIDEHIRTIFSYQYIKVLFKGLYRDNDITKGQYERLIKACDKEIEKAKNEWEVLNGK